MNKVKKNTNIDQLLTVSKFNRVFIFFKLGIKLFGFQKFLLTHDIRSLNKVYNLLA